MPDLGVPVPPNLAEMELGDLLALHSHYSTEHAAIIKKRADLMPMIYAKTAQKNAAERAGFDTVIAQGKAPLNISVAAAKEMLEAAKSGAVTFGKDMLARLKQIAGGGE